MPSPAPSPVRYSTRPLPPYRFLPGKAPHPRRHPQGHSFGQPEPAPPACSPEQWGDSEWYRYGIDLYNFGYWWECHEVFEGLWRVAGPKTPQGQFFQGLIQLAAANLKEALGASGAARNLARRGLERLERMPPVYMGLDVAVFADEVRHYFEGAQQSPPLLRMATAGFAPAGEPPALLSIPPVRALVEAFDPGDDPHAIDSRRATLALLAASPAPFSRSNVQPGHVTGSAVVLSPDRRCALLVFHQRLQRWLQPGGHVDGADRDILTTARRELWEETGIRERPDVPPLLVGVDVHGIPASAREPGHRHHDLVFRFIAAAEDFRPSAETPEIVWCPVEQMDRYALDPFLTRAIARACAAPLDMFR